VQECRQLQLCWMRVSLSMPFLHHLFSAEPKTTNSCHLTGGCTAAAWDDWATSRPRPAPLMRTLALCVPGGHLQP
jgi:hypothetical protein